MVVRRALGTHIAWSTDNASKVLTLSCGLKAERLARKNAVAGAQAENNDVQLVLGADDWDGHGRPSVPNAIETNARREPAAHR